MCRDDNQVSWIGQNRVFFFLRFEIDSGWIFGLFDLESSWIGSDLVSLIF
jgi:hypothetical protein